MSRGNTFDPVVTNQSTVKTASPTIIKAVNIPFDPACRTIVGTQVSVPDLPPSN